MEWSILSVKCTIWEFDSLLFFISTEPSRFTLPWVGFPYVTVFSWNTKTTKCYSKPCSRSNQVENHAKCDASATNIAHEGGWWTRPPSPHPPFRSFLLLLLLSEKRRHSLFIRLLTETDREELQSNDSNVLMVNEFKLTVVHVVHPNPMQICACAWSYHWAKNFGKSWLHRGPPGHWAAADRGPLGRGGPWAWFWQNPWNQFESASFFRVALSRSHAAKFIERWKHI